MTRCPFCAATLSRHAVVCSNCDARRGFEMFGPVPDRPIAAWLKGLLLPAAAILACLFGYFLNPSPIWITAASFGLFVAALGLRRLLEGSRWFHF